MRQATDILPGRCLKLLPAVKQEKKATQMTDKLGRCLKGAGAAGLKGRKEWGKGTFQVLHLYLLHEPFHTINLYLSLLYTFWNSS